MRALIAFLLVFPTFVMSQGAATLVADNVTVSGDRQLVASGNIEVFYDGNRLSAAQIIYDQPSDRLIISGPILIQTADGNILTADQASLDPKLENGMLRGARLVLAQQLQLAANQIDRIDGRYAQLYKVAATSCQICGNRPPLWEIRAKKVVHDQDEQQLYFTDAQFLLRGVPIFWLPRMRLPDPSLERATGFLIPQLRRTDRLGIGVKIPYFIRMGDHRDLTVTPYLSAETTTLELRYRQAFLRGDIMVDAAVSEDTLRPDTTRSYLFAEGAFDLAQDYKLSFDIEAVSDAAYLLDYNISDKDRLDSAITLRRIADTALFQADLTYFQTLRDDEDNASLPPLSGSLSYENRRSLPSGAVFAYGLSGDTAYRPSESDGDLGRDLTRLGGNASLTRTWITTGGLVLQGRIGARADYFAVADDGRYDNGLRIVPFVNATLSYPMSTVTAGGSQHLITPVLAVGWAEAFGTSAPNEDSARSELDQANLFDFNRFAGEDAVETGPQAALGVTWTRLGPKGGSSTLTFGRVVRSATIDGFNPSSGLDGTTSDWLLAGQYKAPVGFQIDGRTLFDDRANVTRAAARIGWQDDTIDLGAAYIWQAADPTESRLDAVSEWSLNSTMQLTPDWAVSADARYDLAQDRPARAGLGIQYQNECVTVDLSVSRRYTSSTTVEPSTSYGVSVALNGFSAKGGTRPAAACGQ